MGEKVGPSSTGKVNENLIVTTQSTRKFNLPGSDETRPNEITVAGCII
jgi:hypothetical protein